MFLVSSASSLALAQPSPAGEAPSPAAATLSFSEETGVVLRAFPATIRLDQNEKLRGPILRFLPDRGEKRLVGPAVSQASAARLTLSYEVDAPAGVRIQVLRELSAATSPTGETELTEDFRLSFSGPLAVDTEIERPFSLFQGSDGADDTAGTGMPSQPALLSAVLPLRNGWAKSVALTNQPVSSEYAVGHAIADGYAPALALPVVEVGEPSRAHGSWRAAISADPRFSSLLELRAAGGPGGGGSSLQGSIRYRYAGKRVPLKGEESRRFAVWLAPQPREDEPFGRSVDSFFRLQLPDVPPGPAWIHDIAMVGYDYLSDGGEGWVRDVKELERLLALQERRRVALCFHGWYDGLGSYAFDEASGKMKDEWIAMPRTRRVRFTKEEVRTRLAATRSLGFRVLWYFGDGLVQDSGGPCYRAEWSLLDESGKSPRPTWTGPDTSGATFIRDPAHPEVARWYKAYLAALLKDYGSAVDGFVWDETYYIQRGDISRSPEPAYCDRAMLDLVRALAQMVRASDPEKVFLSSDNIGVWDNGNKVAYAMVAHGNYQDSWCDPVAWSHALFPNWRNASWSCNWWPITNFHRTRWGVETFGVPVAISNGWENDRGPSEWNDQERESFLDLFRKRCRQGPRVRFLSEDPARLLEKGPEAPAPSDPIPDPAPGESNWALASSGAKATASSESDYAGGQWGPAGLIDGRRDADGWGSGHGWASKSGEALPQWVEVRFPRAREIARFVIITYESLPERASKWGVIDYRVEVWDSAPGRAGAAGVGAGGAGAGAGGAVGGLGGAWRTVVEETQGRIMRTRVHGLKEPVRAERFRVVVTRVAPADSVARLLQVEAWGR